MTNLQYNPVTSPVSLLIFHILDSAEVPIVLGHPLDG